MSATLSAHVRRDERQALDAVAVAVQYRDERPPEALGQATPARRYAPSPRPSPARLPPVEDPAHWAVRRVSRSGGVRWDDAWGNVSHVAGRHRLAEEYVGCEESEAGVWNVAFGPLVLGRFDERTRRITDVNGYRSRHPRQV